MKARSRTLSIFVLAFGLAACESDEKRFADPTRGTFKTPQTNTLSDRHRASVGALSIVRVVATSQTWLPITQIHEYPIRGEVRWGEAFYVRTNIDFDFCSHWRLAIISDGDEEGIRNCAFGQVRQHILVSVADACYPKRVGYFTARVTCVEDESVVVNGFGDIFHVEVPDDDACGNGSCDANVGEGCGSCPGDCPCLAGQHCAGNQCVANPLLCPNGNCDAGENCGTCPADCPCPAGQHCENGQCVANPVSCGNGNCDANENCGTCPGDCPCSAGEHCENGQCVSDPDPCGNGNCDAGENCGNCSEDCGCSAGEHCENDECVPDSDPCGNGSCEGGEDCESCPADCSCPADHGCVGGSCYWRCDSVIMCPEGHHCDGTYCVPD